MRSLALLALAGIAMPAFCAEENRNSLSLACTADGYDGGARSPADEHTRLIEVDQSDRENLVNRKPLILIHGIHGNQRQDRDNDDDIRYINEEYWANFSDYFFRSSNRNHPYKLYRFHYVSDRFSVLELARALRNDVDQEIAARGRDFDRQFALVAHSMGGLVARYYMNCLSHNNGDFRGKPAGDRVSKLITLGTPHHGTPIVGTVSRNELAWVEWHGPLYLASLWYWRSGVRTGFVIGPDEHNRKDLLWDNFDRLVNVRNPDLNESLAQLNDGEAYQGKIISYYGYISQDEPARQDLVEALKATTLGVDRVALAGIMFDFHDDESMKLLVGSIAMDYGLGRRYRDNDGLVPKVSASFEGRQVRRIECVGYDHADMRDGSPRKCADNLTLFQSVGLELGITTPAASVISEAGIVNGASFTSGRVAPGEIITVFGRGLATPGLRTTRIVADSRVATQLGGTSLMFDGVAAPLLYVSENQISGIVPYSVAGRTSVGVAVAYHGVQSNTVTIPVGGSAPGIFTIDSTGKGQAAALNEDGSLNGPVRAIKAGQIAVLYATGEGQTTPAGQDGLLAKDIYPKPRLPVSVLIGGLSADVLYAGAAPRLVAGVLQVNVRVPSRVAPGNVPVVLKIGDASSQPSVSLVVESTADPAGEFVLYGADAPGGSTLYQVDVNTGATRRVGNIASTDITDLAFAPDGSLFGVHIESVLGFVFEALLLRIDPLTGATMTVGDMGTWGVNALVSDSDGTLYGATTSGEFLRIDRTNGKATLVGRYGSGYLSSGDLAFGPDGRLFGTVKGAGSDQLVVINKGTGAAGAIGAIGFTDVYGLAFTPDGRLLGVANRSGSVARLIELDTSSGRGRLIADVRDSRGMGGLAAGFRNWPSNLTLLTRVTTKAIPERNCSIPAATSEFSARDSRIYVWFDTANGRRGDRVSALWRSPSGGVFSQVEWEPLTQDGYQCFWAWLNVSGTPAAQQLGNWIVEIQWNASTLFSSPFSLR